MLKYLKENNINLIHYMDISKNEKDSSPGKIIISDTDEKEVYLVNLPALDKNEFTSLLAMSSEIVGVTGNHSLFQALTLGKFPIYGSYTEAQAGILQQLARFDSHDYLTPVLTQPLFPKHKAKISRKNQPYAKVWTHTVIENQSVNGFLIKLIKQQIINKQKEIKK